MYLRSGIVCFLFCLLSVSAIPWEVQNELDQYVLNKDAVFNWTIMEQFDQHPANFSVSIYSLNVTTHTWMTEEFSDRHTWFHYIQVFVPHNPVFFESATVFIDGGRNSDGPPNPMDAFPMFMAQLAEELGIVTAYLRMIPNQPIIFKDDPALKPRSEDDVIAHTWRKFLDNPSDPEVILQFPMTKGAYWSVTALTELAAWVNPQFQINSYFPSGGSKRGWITWLLGAVDQRVRGMGPIVLSCLNLQKNFHHYFRALNGWSFALVDYWNHNITGDINHPATAELERLIDPLQYNERLTMPKLIVNAVGDEFFMPDDHHYFFSQLTPPKWLLMLPNAEHSTAPWYGKIYRSLRSMVLATLIDHPLPQLEWTRNETDTSGSITLWIDHKENTVVNVTAWSGENNHNDRRDFRYAVLREGATNPDQIQLNLIRWFPGPVESLDDNGQYHVKYDKTPNGTWFGFFIEVEYEGPENKPFAVTTEVNIIPDIFVYEDCVGFDQCQGVLV